MDLVYHQETAHEVIKKLHTNTNGLSNEEVEKRRQQYGRNTMPQPKVKSLFSIFFHQFLNPLIYVLIGAAIISLATGDIKDALFITAIIVINAILGTYQEARAENSAQALRNLVKVMSRVLRDGHVYELDSEELVPGDIVLLESGQKIPADCRLVEVDDLTVEEALLTGESSAVVKQTEPVTGGTELSIGDRTNMVFAATAVQKGRGKGIVAQTGLHTQIGKIAGSLSTTEAELPPLVNRMEAFAKRISIITLAICIVLGVIGYFEGMPVKEIFFLMVAVGVAAIPEGLPVALTVALSIGTRRMAKRNVIVRKLPAVEGLGSCTLIASDKTGTLTMDQQSVKQVYLPGDHYYEITGQGYNGDGKWMYEGNELTVIEDPLHRFLQGCILSNEGILRKTSGGWEHSGDAVDVALRALAYKIGKTPAWFKNDVTVVKSIPYESERQYSAVFFKKDEQLQYAMKGAAEVVLKHLTGSDREELSEISEQMAAGGFRVLALAGGPVDTIETSEIPPLKILGLIGLIDPLRAEAKEAVHKCRQAGIEVLMVTGDHPSTALAIAKELDIAQHTDEVISGAELSGMEDLSIPDLAEKMRNKKVFARVAPLQKKRIVDAMKSLGHFVAVTGDGANDAPALKSAHIGVAMGAGTDLAKEAASIIVTDNNFASITAGVEEGRITFDNLRKIIYMLISTGVAELLTVGLAIIFNVPLPFLAIQLLWLNLVTNGIQDMALAFEKGNEAVMQKPPRKPDESIFDKLMNTQIIVSGLYIAGIVFGIWYYLIYVLNYNEVHARSVVMMVMVMLQNFHVVNCRSETKSIFKIPIKNNYVLLIGILLAQLVHIAASYTPGLRETLHLEPITLQEWMTLLPTAASIIVVMEVFKWIWRKVHK